MVIITSIRISESSVSVCPGNCNNGVYFEPLNFDNIICSITHALYNVVSFSIIVDILYPFLFAFGNLLLVFFFVIPTFIKFSFQRFIQSSPRSISASLPNIIALSFNPDLLIFASACCLIVRVSCDWKLLAY